MSLYAAFEWLVIAALLLLSLRVVWQRVVKPALQKPKVACGNNGCSSCSQQSSQQN